ncbi:MAG TPA: hypothetical protein ENJ20_05165 [Bacteroidetes bacterium]|nr:hypothetical protein [Bacteroidota bacterium]
MGKYISISTLYCIAIIFLVAAGTGCGEKVKTVDHIVIRPVGNTLKFETEEFTVKAGSTVTAVMDNTATSPALLHNVVMCSPNSNINELGLAAVKAGEETGYVPDDERVKFVVPMAKPGEKTEIKFVAPPPGDYPFFCSYPGHFGLMQGVMHSVE